MTSEYSEEEAETKKDVYEEEEDWLGQSDGDDPLQKREREIINERDQFLDAPQPKFEFGEPIADFDSVLLRAQQAVRILCNFSQAPKDTTRAQFRKQLYDDICALYGYNQYLVSKIDSLLPTAEILSFCEACEHQRSVVIRTNTLKTRRKELIRLLNARGINVDATCFSWNKVGLVVLDSQVPVGATPEYLSGLYMLQSPSSFLPVIALNPQPGDRVLDMCAAPGGKTTHMAQLMKNTGLIIANDLNKLRLKALVANLHRLSVTNTIVVNYNACAFPQLFGGFNCVLLDAPCSGTGVISRDFSIKATKSESEVHLLSQRQKELILHAYDSISYQGGRIVYCTCSVLVEENEAVVDYLINNRQCKCISAGIEEEFDESELVKGIYKYQGKHFHPSIKNARRVYPHKPNMDGFFFALISVPAHQINQISQNEAPNQKKKKKFSKKYGGK